MKTQNLVYIMSDEHSAKMLGCYGHEMVQTPNLDKLAARGTRFTAHYTNSPVCIPARAAFATGQYTHETRYWDNATPYDGAVRSWGHRLGDEGVISESIGKLHYRNKDLDTGFKRQHHPMHVMNGIGQVWGSVRDPLPITGPSRTGRMLGDIGPGESDTNRYDRSIADTACKWLTDISNKPSGRPWVLYLGFVAPHFPLVVPQKYFDLYPVELLPPRKLDPLDGYNRHPWIERMDKFKPHDAALTAEERLRAVAAYFGLCSFVDAQIGKILETLAETGLDSKTRIIYTSDHGDNVGARALWGKSNMYEESAAIPLIISGDNVPEGKICNTPTSLLDSYQTVLDGVGLDLTLQEQKLPGTSWFKIALSEDDPDRTVFSEYHGAGSPSGAFMLRKGKYKFIYYVGYEPELFDLTLDPEEITNLANKENYQEIAHEYEGFLRDICDPEKIDRQAKNDQNVLVEKFGGREKALGTGTPGATPVPNIRK